MLSYEELSKRPETFRSFTGLEVSEFDSIYAEVEPRYEEFERKRLSGGNRKNDIGAGYPFKLSLRDRLLMLLVYYRTHITSTIAGFLFDLDQSNVLKDIRMLEPLVRECIPIPKKVYEGARRARTLEEVELSILPRVQGVHRRHGAGDTPAVEGQEEEEDALLREEEAHREDAAHGQLTPTV